MKGGERGGDERENGRGGEWRKGREGRRKEGSERERKVMDAAFKFLNTPLYPATIEGWYHGTSVLNSVMTGYW